MSSPRLPRIAGTAATSSCRLSVTAHQPSDAGSKKLAPPAETRPPRVRPENAARPAINSAGSASTDVPVPTVTRANSAVTWPSITKAGAGEATGKPSGMPVSAIAPDAAQSNTAHLSRMTHYRADSARCASDAASRPANGTCHLLII